MNHDDFVTDIKAMLLEEAEPPISSECCIYRVPFHIRRVNEDAYTPKVVSIGPFHRRHPPLQSMERYKLIYCKAFLQRSKASVDSLLSHIQEIEPRFLRCYSETLELSDKELVKMILVDSCFLFELFWRYFYNEWSGDDDDTFISKPWVSTNIRLDLLLLENQLPFFVLDKLFNLSFTSASGYAKIPSFLQLTFDYFDDYNGYNNKSDRSNRSKLHHGNITTIKHFTDLIRTFHLQHPPQRRPGRKKESVTHLQSATELLAAGLRFKVNTKSDCLLDLRFSGRVLEIPQLKVEDWTEILFRNMVALEQCHYPKESYITDYIAVLDFLINTGRDVDLLVRKRILVNWLGDSDSAANLFNGLWKNITHLYFNSDYFLLCEDLNDYCRDPWRRLRATLKRDYCGTPWQTAASIAGIVILILSLLQSVCAVLQVVQQYQSSKT